MMTKQRAVNRGFDSRQGREMSPLQSVQTGSGVHPPSHIQSEPGALSDVVKRLGTKITIHLHLMLRLGMSEAIPILPTCLNGVAFLYNTNWEAVSWVWISIL